MSRTQPASELQPPREDVSARLRLAQVIHASLGLSIATLGVAGWLVGPLQPSQRGLGLDPVAVGFGAVSLVCVALSFALPARLVGNVPREEPGRRLSTWLTGRILAAALCEGPALLWGVLLLLRGDAWLAAPLAALIVVFALHTPTAGALRNATDLRAAGEP